MTVMCGPPASAGATGIVSGTGAATMASVPPAAALAARMVACTGDATSNPTRPGTYYNLTTNEVAQRITSGDEIIPAACNSVPHACFSCVACLVVVAGHEQREVFHARCASFVGDPKVLQERVIGLRNTQSAAVERAQQWYNG